MRRRNTELRTGSLVAWFDERERSRNASILFLVTGAGDIDTLAAIERACRKEGPPALEFHVVADQIDLGVVDPRLNPETMLRIEAAELAGLAEDELREVLAPALRQLAQGARPAFPDAALAVGGVAEGVQFLNRDEDLASLRRLVLEDGRSTLLVAPRRTGKTSLLRRFKEQLGDSARVEMLDLERYNSLKTAAAGIWAAVFHAKPADARREVEQHDWKDAIGHAVRELAQSGKPGVLILDELVWFFEDLASRAEAVEFLAVLGAAAVESKVRVLTASSRDLSDYAHAELGKGPEDLPAPFGDPARHVLRPPPDHVLRIELRRVLIGTGLVLEAGDLDWLTSNVDLAMPHPAMRFLSQLASHLRAKSPLDVGGLAVELTNFLRTTDVFNEIQSHIQDKQRRERGVGERVTKALCTIVLAPSPGAPEADVIAELGGADEEKGKALLAWLLDTLPVRHEGDRVAPASRLFRRWWMEREGIEE
jgi:hypothetical protein